MSTIITIIIITLLLSAFFSGIEIAFISSNRLKLELDRNNNSFISRVINIFSKNESNFIATMLVGNNIALVFFSIFMTKLLDPILFAYLSSSFLVLLVQTIISTIIVLVFAEFIPKAIFRIRANYMIRLFCIPLLIFYFILFPIVLVVISISKFILKYFLQINITEVEQFFNKIDLDEYLESLTKETKKEGINTELEMLQNALELSNIKMRECMVPRADLTAININSSISELKELFIQTKYTKIPVFKNNIDNIIGYVHSSDLFKSPINIKSMILPIPIVTESLTANEMLNIFIDKCKSIALVVDEFRGTSGLVTVEEVTEEIVGEIEDEHDQGELVDLEISKEEYLFSARMEVDQINSKYNLNLIESEEYETIAGLFLSYHEDIPVEGEKIELDNLIIIIDEVDQKSIKLIRVKLNR